MNNNEYKIQRMKITDMVNKSYQPKYCIILTTTVNTNLNVENYQNNSQDRLKTYLQSIKQWLKDKECYIVIVENSGYKFEELDLEINKHEVIYFKESEQNEAKLLSSSSDKSLHEFYSINYALKNSKIIKMMKADDYIFKLTGRYYIPNFIDHLKVLKNDTEIVIQSTNHKMFYRLGIRCEIIGCRKYISQYLFNVNFKENRYAEMIYSSRAKNFKNIVKLPHMKIDTFFSGHFLGPCDII